MTSRKTAFGLSVLLLLALSACASSPTPPPPQLLPAPAEMTTPVPPPQYFMTKLEAILSKRFVKPTPSPIASEHASPATTPDDDE